MHKKVIGIEKCRNFLIDYNLDSAKIVKNCEFEYF